MHTAKRRKSCTNGKTSRPIEKMRKNRTLKRILAILFCFFLFFAMNQHDNLVIQIAVAMIIIALLGLTVIKASNRTTSVPLPPATTQPIAVKVQQGSVEST
jgi:hypothetical protein